MLTFKIAETQDTQRCIDIRGLTRENPVSEQRLAELGITLDTWSQQVANKELTGMLALIDGEIQGYCFGEVATGEIVVLALLPHIEGMGIGKHLLGRVMQELFRHGHNRLFLGCDSRPHVRSYGFYRHLGWVSTGKKDRLGDEELEFLRGELSAYFNDLT